MLLGFALDGIGSVLRRPSSVAFLGEVSCEPGHWLGHWRRSY